MKSVKPHKDKPRNVPSHIVCPLYGAPHEYIYDNSGGRGQFKCKICQQIFVNGEKFLTPLKLLCPYCGHVLQPVKDRKPFRVHKCINNNCSYYRRNLKKLPPDLPRSDYWKYKLRYLYREFSVNFFDMDLNQLPTWVTSFKYKKKMSISWDCVCPTESILNFLFVRLFMLSRTSTVLKSPTLW